MQLQSVFMTMRLEVFYAKCVQTLVWFASSTPSSAVASVNLILKP
jgi:hypothetical protein